MISLISFKENVDNTQWYSQYTKVQETKLKLCFLLSFNKLTLKFSTLQGYALLCYQRPQKGCGEVGETTVELGYRTNKCDIKSRKRILTPSLYD